MSRDGKNPQAAEMAHESMVRCLEAQARAIWPQERELLEREPLGAGARVLDVACGTGEISGRLARAWPGTEITGIDVHEPHLALARERHADLEERVRFLPGDAYALDFPDDHFDLALCRHLLQAVPEPERILDEMRRVVKPGGRLHVVSEDYGMMHFHPTPVDVDRFWREGPMTFARRTGSDLTTGRQTWSLMRAAGLEDLDVDYVVLDPLRVPRPVLADIFLAWRDGYAAGIAAETDLTREEVDAAFEAILHAVSSPEGYGVWQLPVVRGRVPGS